MQLTSFDIIAVHYVLWQNCYRLPPVRKGGENMDGIIGFIFTVMAGVACHCINKWLDGDK